MQVGVADGRAARQRAARQPAELQRDRRVLGHRERAAVGARAGVAAARVEHGLDARAAVEAHAAAALVGGRAVGAVRVALVARAVAHEPRVRGARVQPCGRL